jgi:2-methylcitrate dehydratase
MAYDQVIVEIKNYVFSYDITSQKAWKNARIALLDAMGCCIETVHRSADCKKLFGPWVPETTVPSGFRLPGTAHCHSVP